MSFSHEIALTTIGLLVLVSGCTKSPDGKASPITTVTVPASSAPRQPVSSTTPTAPPQTGQPLTPTTGGKQSPDASSCMDACMRDNQMRAVGIEVIEQDCRKRCHR